MVKQSILCIFLRTASTRLSPYSHILRALENDHFTLLFQVLDLETLPPYIEQKNLIHFFHMTRTSLCLFLFRCRVTYEDDNSEAKKLDASRFMVSRRFKEKSQF